MSKTQPQKFYYTAVWAFQRTAAISPHREQLFPKHATGYVIGSLIFDREKDANKALEKITDSFDTEGDVFNFMSAVHKREVHTSAENIHGFALEDSLLQDERGRLKAAAIIHIKRAIDYMKSGKSEDEISTDKELAVVERLLAAVESGEFDNAEIRDLWGLGIEIIGDLIHRTHRLEKTRISDKEIEILKQVANRTWQTVSQDLSLSSYSRAQVFEFTVDADRMKGFCENDEQKAAVLKFYKLSWEQMRKLSVVFFPFENYE